MTPTWRARGSTTISSPASPGSGAASPQPAPGGRHKLLVDAMHESRFDQAPDRLGDRFGERQIARQRPLLDLLAQLFVQLVERMDSPVSKRPEQARL